MPSPGGDRGRRPRCEPSQDGKVALLEYDPDLGEDLGRDEIEAARVEVLAELVRYPLGPWDVRPDDFDQVANFGLLVTEGLLAREVTVGDYTCAELLGPGDVLQPWLRIGPEQSVATEVDWEVVQPLQAAVLGRDFSACVARWPEIPATVSRRLMQRSHWLAFQLAVCGLRRVDDRLLLVLWHFADRWGTMTPEGVRLDVRLTHDLLAAAIGARRPSVGNALRRLTDQGRIRRLPRFRWLLLGQPPAEMETLHHRSNPPAARRRVSDEEDSAPSRDG